MRNHGARASKTQPDVQYGPAQKGQPDYSAYWELSDFKLWNADTPKSKEDLFLAWDIDACRYPEEISVLHLQVN